MYVVATAGHVDHGKSTLVRALTGMEPDRWAEERRRGMTIDLGYAWMTLPARARGSEARAPEDNGPAGEMLAFVDVPGHERFVPNMLAGLGPVPAVLFVVAADGGWMPQSAEHLAAVDALGVRHGLLVITRSDLADPEPATRQARAEIARTSLGAVEAVPVSAVTGQGLDQLKEALVRLVDSLSGRSGISGAGGMIGAVGTHNHRNHSGGLGQPIPSRRHYRRKRLHQPRRELGRRWRATITDHLNAVSGNLAVLGLLNHLQHCRRYTAEIGDALLLDQLESTGRIPFVHKDELSTAHDSRE